MLVLVLIVFAICWLPLNMYHILMDFWPQLFSHNFIVFIAVHWLAMSSVCYNPFIYSVRNFYFRQGVKNLLNFLICRYNKIGRSRHSPESIVSVNTRITNSSIIRQQTCKTSSEESMEMNGTTTKQTDLTAADNDNNNSTSNKSNIRWLDLCRTARIQTNNTSISNV
ncbi:substance-K receptor-like [Oppia nitens]|uniref:substance-K receptor-like n=1 Tax=Oppia nitens TaxID=1686743 RepID=UPI0023DC4139|nr:substance-K receptor-like [Oppia nitens]